MHLILDIRCTNQELLINHESLSEWMLLLCHEIGMTPVGNPIIQDFLWPGGKVAVPSACLFLAESSITLHVYPEFNYLYLDIFSCKNFDTAKAIEFVNRTLSVTHRTTYAFKRGINMETREPLQLVPTFP